MGTLSTMLNILNNVACSYYCTLVMDNHIYCTCSISEAICFREGSVASVETSLSRIIVCIVCA